MLLPKCVGNYYYKYLFTFLSEDTKSFTKKFNEPNEFKHYSRYLSDGSKLHSFILGNDFINCVLFLFLNYLSKQVLFC